MYGETIEVQSLQLCVYFAVHLKYQTLELVLQASKKKKKKKKKKKGRKIKKRVKNCVF